MAVKLRQPGQQITAASAAAIALAGLLAAPVLAAPERDLLCDDSATPATLAVSPSELTATPLNSSDELLENHLLRPDARAAARTVFPERTPAADDRQSDARDAEETDAIAGEPDVRGASEYKRPAYKRQMYRRDI